MDVGASFVMPPSDRVEMIVLFGRWTLRSNDESMSSSLLRALFIFTDHHQWKVSTLSLAFGFKID